ncbi:MAG: hypothetical protein JWO82_1071 [Akkermansiaceae bacterium]|nr:hypothetical protein [Akkermansiaceae bacterium]
MALRSVVGLLLGMVLQVFLVVPGGALTTTAPCAIPQAAVVCSCCHQETSCPCAKTTEQKEKPPVPEAPSSSTLKIDVAFVPEAVQPLPFAAGIEYGSLLPERSPPARAGYSGVGLSVAFCRLVI